jgi:type IV pilus assembly protein PilQ
LSARGSLMSEQRTNQLFVTDIPSKLEEIQSLIAKIDIPVRQVQIEARIVEANDTWGRSLGVRLGGRLTNLSPDGQVGYPRGAIGPSIIVPPGAPATPITTGSFVNLPAQGQGGFDPANFSLALFNRDASRLINVELSALEADGKGKIVSSPRIVTADQIKALISQGTKVPFQKSTSSGATSVEFVEATLKLEVTPQITPEGNVILDVKVNKDSLGTLTALGREINIKEVKTNVLVENGGTVVIGGIFEQNESVSTAKVPFLGDLPYLGNLFKSTTKDTQRTELLVFLTPRIVTEKASVR